MAIPRRAIRLQTGAAWMIPLGSNPTTMFKNYSLNNGETEAVPLSRLEK